MGNDTVPRMEKLCFRKPVFQEGQLSLVSGRNPFSDLYRKLPQAVSLQYLALETGCPELLVMRGPTASIFVGYRIGFAATSTSESTNKYVLPRKSFVPSLRRWSRPKEVRRKRRRKTRGAKALVDKSLPLLHLQFLLLHHPHLRSLLYLSRLGPLLFLLQRQLPRKAKTFMLAKYKNNRLPLCYFFFGDL